MLHIIIYHRVVRLLLEQCITGNLWVSCANKKLYWTTVGTETIQSDVFFCFFLPGSVAVDVQGPGHEDNYHWSDSFAFAIKIVVT